MKQISYTSIVVFSYNRPNLLKNLIESLKKNKEASSSKIFFFQDNYKNNRDKKDVYKCIKYINSIKGFKKKIIFVRKKNLGFYDNFIKGLKYFFSIEKKGIILEDDLIVSEYFLKFMNQALEKYRNKKKVWSISGWNYNINLNFKHDAYFMRNFMSWSWATWEDRFRRYEKNPEKIIQNWNKKKLRSLI